LGADSLNIPLATCHLRNKYELVGEFEESYTKVYPEIHCPPSAVSHYNCSFSSGGLNVGVEDEPCSIIDTILLAQLPDISEAGTSPDVYVFGKLHPFVPFLNFWFLNFGFLCTQVQYYLGTHELTGPAFASAHVNLAWNTLAPVNILFCAVVAAVPVHEEMSWLNA
jgi:hypothetical protein